MENQKHTPGDWIYDKDVHAVISENCPHEGNIICVLPSKDYVSYEFWNANAKLIAAAPEMLEALRNIVDYWNSGNFSRDHKMWSNMESIIKKATE